MVWKVVLDTNVIFSALAFDRMVEEVWVMVLEDRARFLTYRSPQTTEELELKLKSKKFLSYRDFTLSQVSLVLGYYYEHTTLVDTKFSIEISRDPKDNMFLELAKQVQADYLISGDKDLLELEQFETAKILTPSKFLQGLK